MAEQEDSEELEQLKQRLAELEETAREYKDLFENARDVIVVFDLKGNVTAVNKAISDYGFVPEDLLRKNMSTSSHRNTGHGCLRNWRR